MSETLGLSLLALLIAFAMALMIGWGVSLGSSVVEWVPATQAG
jgi:hypothetical protein